MLTHPFVHLSQKVQPEAECSAKDDMLRLRFPIMAVHGASGSMRL